MALIDDLIREGWLKTPLIIEAFKNIERGDFLPNEIKNSAQENEALPIGYNQTISQPLTVAFMLEKLDPKPSHKILDIGSGSGFSAALLSYIVGQNGKVIAIERIPELKNFGEKNVSKYGFVEKGIAEFVCADGSKGYQKEAPYDRILVSAVSLKVFPQWKDQLKVKGKIVCPLGQSIEKISQNDYKKKEYPGFVFVPLVEG
jgi:protein-L-isoaspartate(D-aspartate) O-methyltransferase